MEGNILDLAISEIEKQKFSLHESKLPSTKVGLTDALGVLNYLKEEHFINCECGHSVEHKHSFTNEDGQVTCISCVNATLQAELEKAKELLRECQERFETILVIGVERDEVNVLIRKLNP